MTAYGKFDIRKFSAKYGALKDKAEVSKSEWSSYVGKLPPDLIAFWQENGIGIWLNGKFQLCMPSAFSEICDILFHGDPDIDPKETHVVGYSGFGDLLLWNETLQTCEVDLRLSTMNVGKWDYTEFGVTDTPLAAVVSRLDSVHTFYIPPDRPGYTSLFDEAVDLLGPIKLGQCYGFFPALALGGAEKIEHVQIVDAKNHFTMLAEMGPLRLRQLTERNQIEFLRNAGPQ